MKKKRRENEGNECGMEDGRGEEVAAGNGWLTSTSRMFFR